MPLNVECPACGDGLEVGDEFRGWTVRCPSCRHEFVAQSDEPPAPRFRTAPRRRRPRDEDDEDIIAWAEEDIRTPANLTRVFGWLGILFGLLTVLLFAVLLAQAVNKPRNPRNNPGNPPGLFNNDPAELTGNLIGACLNVGAAVLVVIGAGKMGRLESRGWAMTAAILTIIPCFNWCCLLGMPLGIWTLTVLSRPDVKEGFDLVARSRFRRRSHGLDEEDDND